MLEQISTFFAHNYLWFVFIGIILVMALIGYVADKKNLIKTSVKSESSNKKTDIAPEKTIEEPIEVINKEENIVFEDSPVISEESDINSLEHINLNIEEDIETIEQPVEVVEEPEINTMEMPIFEDVNIPSNNIDSKVNNKVDSTETPKIEEVPQELFQPMGDLNFDKQTVVESDPEKEEMDVWQF